MCGWRGSHREKRGRGVRERQRQREKTEERETQGGDTELGRKNLEKIAQSVKFLTPQFQDQSLIQAPHSDLDL